MKSAIQFALYSAIMYSSAERQPGKTRLGMGHKTDATNVRSSTGLTLTHYFLIRCALRAKCIQFSTKWGVSILRPVIPSIFYITNVGSYCFRILTSADKSNQ